LAEKKRSGKAKAHNLNNKPDLEKKFLVIVHECKPIKILDEDKEEVVDTVIHRNRRSR
jgi:hypothetical protein